MVSIFNILILFYSYIKKFKYEYLPSSLFLFVFGLFSIMHSLLLIFLPETVGKPMIETIEELNAK